MTSQPPPFVVDGHSVAPGTRRYLELPLPEIFGQAVTTMPVVVCHGRKPGPALFVSAAIHGDEIIGTEIVGRLLSMVKRRRLRGTLVAVPVVNAYGFMTASRYLPDRRDLNRSFPGSPEGSLAGRLADRFLTTIVDVCSHGIDLHSGAVHRTNLPQVRACLEDAESARLANAFGTPVIVHSDLRDGSLRAAAKDRGKPIILFEGGEALRLDETAVRAGVRGCWQVLRTLGMLGTQPAKPKNQTPTVTRRTIWRRAPCSGLVQLQVGLGARIEPGQVLAIFTDPCGRELDRLLCLAPGIVIGAITMPLVNAGDAVLHVARFADVGMADRVADHIERFEQSLDGESEP
ncbi:MAG: succinylglutamate desuccinylase [Planctomycetota bacterium]|nr:MAG: succinylglutamate desuccinylase [Planctomycetota bacterium]